MRDRGGNTAARARARGITGSSSSRVIPESDGYVRAGKVFSVRLSVEQRESIVRFANELRERGTIGYELCSYGGAVKLGPFLVWCAGALRHELTNAPGAPSRNRKAKR